MVVYSGSRPWSAPRDIFTLFGEHEALARQWLFQPYALLDIKALDDDTIQQHAWCGLMEFALKHRQVKNFTQFLETLLPWLHRIELESPQAGIIFGKILLKYVVDGIESKEVDVFMEKVDRYLSSKLRGEAMTLAQQFELLGVEKGISQGRQEGMEKGERAKAQAIAKSMLLDDEPLDKILRYTGLSVDEIALLRKKH